ncbi:hypothetical protein MTO96_035499 [Rhipicephalus appendiculatus]
MPSLKNLIFVFVTILIIIKEKKISARPESPSGHGVMFACGVECFISKNGNASGCPEGCRCVSKQFREGIYTGAGHCWYEKWYHQAQ